MLTILATDINPRFLKKAMAGIYGEWSFRDIPAHVKQRYFTETTAGRFEINPLIKRQVTFSTLHQSVNHQDTRPIRDEQFSSQCPHVFFGATSQKRLSTNFMSHWWMEDGLSLA